MHSDAVYATEHSIDGLGGLQALHGAKSIVAIMGDCTCFLVLKVGGAQKNIIFHSVSPIYYMYKSRWNLPLIYQETFQRYTILVP